MTYEAVEYTPTKFTLVAYYDKDMNPRKISRFQDASKAKNAILTSLLAGQHADIVARDLLMKDVKSFCAHFKEHNDIPKFAPTIPNQPKKLVIVKEPKAHVRTEKHEIGVFTIRRMKAKFV